jgi:DMSO/TMAO reductase YedYZ molybdopterin-dependent catalytic subunit
MPTLRVSHGVAGIIAGLAGLAASHATALVMTPLRPVPFALVSDLVVRYTPAAVATWIIDVIGPLAKPLLVAVLVAVMLLLFLTAGRLALRAWWAPVPVYAVMGGVAAWAVAVRFDDRLVDYVPPTAGVVVAIVVLSLLTHPMRHVGDRAEGETRRGVLLRAGIVGAGAVGAVVTGEVVGRGKLRVERSRRLLNLPVTSPPLPYYVRLQGEGLSRWQTPTGDFYRVDTAVISVPAVDPTSWRLRIHGMVERELVLTYQDLLDRRIAEDWITLSCVSNPVGGTLVGNAWWSGIPLEALLREAGVREGADAVLQTSTDGWTCGTPLEAMTDGRSAMLAIAMNGDPLPLEHGFPVRTIVPGLYGYVSACKWVTDLKVTRFDRIAGFWAQRGWAEEAPVKITSRVDVPVEGAEVPSGSTRVGGVAWYQHVGIEGVEYAVDGGPWLRAETGGVARHPDGEDNVDTWVQWAATVELEPGEHSLRVRALGRDGTVQTGAVSSPRPDGATGWHTVRFAAVE